MFRAGFCQVDWLDEKCEDDVPESARRWLAEAKPEFGLHGFFKAKKSVVKMDFSVVNMNISKQKSQ